MCRGPLHAGHAGHARSREMSEPYYSVSGAHMLNGRHRNKVLTSIDILLNTRLDRALVLFRNTLGLEPVAEQWSRVHGALEGIALPGKEVIGVGAGSLAVVVAPHEWLRAVGGPERLVVEPGGVPHGLEG